MESCAILHQSVKTSSLAGQATELSSRKDRGEWHHLDHSSRPWVFWISKDLRRIFLKYGKQSCKNVRRAAGTMFCSNEPMMQRFLSRGKDLIALTSLCRSCKVYKIWETCVMKALPVVRYVVWKPWKLWKPCQYQFWARPQGRILISRLVWMWPFLWRIRKQWDDSARLSRGSRLRMWPLFWHFGAQVIRKDRC